MTKRITVAVCAGIFSLGIATSAEALLLSRLGGLAVYDTDLDITWLADANANGSMNWATATAWAAGLSVGGFTDWRLPTTADPDPSCTDDTAGLNPSADAMGFNCTGSELGHLFYVELGGTAGSSVLASGDPDLALFSNLETDDAYWSATLVSPTVAYGWNFANGGQSDNGTSNFDYAIAVRSGDVPEPGATLLMAVGLGSALALRTRRR